MCKGCPVGKPGKQGVDGNNGPKDIQGIEVITNLNNKTMETQELTYGQKAVGLNFNPAEGEINAHVHSAKQLCADAIDMMNTIKERSSVTYPDQYPLGFSGERIALSMIAIRKLQSAQMDMVKAITWKD